MNTTQCCALIDPAVYDRKEFDWTGQSFIRTRIRSFLHMPLTFSSAIKRLTAQAERANALPPESEQLWLCDENSLWGADLYLAVTKPVSGSDNANLSGVWRARVFEGPYSKIGSWYQSIAPFKRALAFYTACPKCAKKFGKNYVVLFSQ